MFDNDNMYLLEKCQNGSKIPILKVNPPDNIQVNPTVIHSKTLCYFVSCTKHNTEFRDTAQYERNQLSYQPGSAAALSVQLQLSVDLSVTALLALIPLVGHINNHNKYQPPRKIQYCVIELEIKLNAQKRDRSKGILRSIFRGIGIIMHQ